jgi:hypothetical protein
MLEKLKNPNKLQDTQSETICPSGYDVNRKTINRSVLEQSGLSTLLGPLMPQAEDCFHHSASQSPFKFAGNPIILLHKILRYQTQSLAPYSLLDPFEAFLDSPSLPDYIMEQGQSKVA